MTKELVNYIIINIFVAQIDAIPTTTNEFNLENKYEELKYKRKSCAG